MHGAPLQGVTPFVIPQPTPRTETSLSMSNTPKKFQSPGSAVRDLTDQMSSLDSSMKSPPKDLLNTTINPQSKRKQ